MQTNSSYVLFAISLAVLGVALFMSSKPLDRWGLPGNAPGKKRLDTAPRPKSKVTLVGNVYSIFCFVFVIMAALNVYNRWPVILRDDITRPSAERYVDWIKTAKAVAVGDASVAIVHAVPRFGAGTKQVIVQWLTAKPERGQMNYRWFVDRKPMRDFALGYEGDVHRVPLNDRPEQALPPGDHEVYLIHDGVTVAMVRFLVSEP